MLFYTVLLSIFVITELIQIKQVARGGLWTRASFCYKLDVVSQD